MGKWNTSVVSTVPAGSVRSIGEMFPLSVWLRVVFRWRYMMQSTSVSWFFFERPFLPAQQSSPSSPLDFEKYPSKRTLPSTWIDSISSTLKLMITCVRRDTVKAPLCHRQPSIGGWRRFCGRSERTTEFAITQQEETTQESHSQRFLLVATQNYFGIISIKRMWHKLKNTRTTSETCCDAPNLKKRLLFVIHSGGRTNIARK